MEMSQEKSKTMHMPIFLGGGGRGLKEVYYGICASTISYQSLRYPCPAEWENEDLSKNAFELGISLAINRACTVSPEVDKQ